MALAEHDPSARIQLRRMSELQQPGTCYVCGNGTCEGGYIDFTTFVDYHGALYICKTCTMQAAETIGYYSPEEVASMVDAGNKALAIQEALQKELEESREHINHLNGVLQSKFSPGNGVVGNDVSADTSEPKPDPKPFVRSEGGKSESEEPVKVPGRKHPSRIKSLDFTE